MRATLGEHLVHRDPDDLVPHQRRVRLHSNTARQLAPLLGHLTTKLRLQIEVTLPLSIGQIRVLQPLLDVGPGPDRHRLPGTTSWQWQPRHTRLSGPRPEPASHGGSRPRFGRQTASRLDGYDRIWRPIARTFARPKQDHESVRCGALPGSGAVSD